jgi:hypothetical protein
VLKTSHTSHTSQTMTIRKEQPEQHQQSLSQALSTDLQGRGMPGHQTPTRRMSREEQRAYLLSTLQLAIDITTSSDVDASSFESPRLVSSTSRSKKSDGSSQAKQ